MGWSCFNSQPREGGWDLTDTLTLLRLPVSTRSRAKAAGTLGTHTLVGDNCFNSQPREGGWYSHTSRHR